jgi:hypothetical protein
VIACLAIIRTWSIYYFGQKKNQINNHELFPHKIRVF